MVYNMIRAKERMLKGRMGVNLDKAPIFKGFDERSQSTILWIYETKREQGELDNKYVKDSVSGIEYAARLYHEQRCAFQDVLTRRGFEVTQEALTDYEGRVAFLTDHGTLTVLGKPKTMGRHITMNRIHSPKINYTHCRGHVKEDLKLGERPQIDILNGTSNTYQGSLLRGLAINPRGADGDELEARQAETLIRMIDDCATQSMAMPRKVEEILKEIQAQGNS